jgi:hypothetical protein
LEDENQQLRAQINAAPAHASREQHAGAISNSSPSHAVHDFFSVTEGGEGVGFGSATGFGNSGGMVEVKAKPKLGEGAQVKAALGTGAVAAAALPNYFSLSFSKIQRSLRGPRKAILARYCRSVRFQHGPGAAAAVAASILLRCVHQLRLQFVQPSSTLLIVRRSAVYASPYIDFAILFYSS